MDPNVDPTKTPGMVPPGNRVSQFDAPWNSLQNGVVISFGVTFALATIFLGLRFFQAIRLVKKFEIDLGKSSYHLMSIALDG